MENLIPQSSVSKSLTLFSLHSSVLSLLVSSSPSFLSAIVALLSVVGVTLCRRYLALLCRHHSLPPLPCFPLSASLSAHGTQAIADVLRLLIFPCWSRSLRPVLSDPRFFSVLYFSHSQFNTSITQSLNLSQISIIKATKCDLTQD